MNNSSLPSLKSYLPARGTAFFTIGDDPIIRASRDPFKVVSFLQARRPDTKRIQLADWWEHDGLYFDTGGLDFRGMSQIVEKPRSILENMPGDENLLGRFSITCDGSLAPGFESAVMPNLD